MLCAVIELLHQLLLHRLAKLMGLAVKANVEGTTNMEVTTKGTSLHWLIHMFTLADTHVECKHAWPMVSLAHLTQ